MAYNFRNAGSLGYDQSDPFLRRRLNGFPASSGFPTWGGNTNYWLHSRAGNPGGTGRYWPGRYWRGGNTNYWLNGGAGNPGGILGSIVPPDTTGGGILGSIVPPDTTGGGILGSIVPPDMTGYWQRIADILNRGAANWGEVGVDNSGAGNPGGILGSIVPPTMNWLRRWWR